MRRARGEGPDRRPAAHRRRGRLAGGPGRVLDPHAGREPDERVRAAGRRVMRERGPGTRDGRLRLRRGPPSVGGRDRGRAWPLRRWIRGVSGRAARQARAGRLHGRRRSRRSWQRSDRPPGPARRARQMLYGGMEAEWAAPAGRQSLRWMWHELEYGGNYFGDAPDGGYRRLVGAMASGVDVRLGRPVSEIAVSPGRSAGGDRRRHGRGRHARRGDGAARRAQARRAAVLPLRCRGTGSRPSGGLGSAVSRRWRCGSPNPSGARPASRT